MTDFEREDMELKAIMGGKFVDETAPISEAKAKPTTHKKTAENPTKKPMDEEWHPVKPKNNLAECAKSTLIYGGLNALILYWQINGLMADSIALPCMLVCAALAGWSIGKAFGGAK